MKNFNLLFKVFMATAICATCAFFAISCDNDKDEYPVESANVNVEASTYGFTPTAEDIIMLDAMKAYNDSIATTSQTRSWYSRLFRIVYSDFVGVIVGFNTLFHYDGHDVWISQSFSGSICSRLDYVINTSGNLNSNTIDFQNLSDVVLRTGIVMSDIEALGQIDDAMELAQLDTYDIPNLPAAYSQAQSVGKLHNLALLHLENDRMFSPNIQMVNDTYASMVSNTRFKNAVRNFMYRTQNGNYTLDNTDIVSSVINSFTEAIENVTALPQLIRTASAYFNLVNNNFTISEDEKCAIYSSLCVAVYSYGFWSSRITD